MKEHGALNVLKIYLKEIFIALKPEMETGKNRSAQLFPEETLTNKYISVITSTLRF
jgi:hypothetical protein